MNQLKVEGKSQPSFYSSPSLEVKTENESLKNDKSLTGEASQCPIPRLFALIIGINVYQNHSYPKLRGAVPDGKAFKCYLMKRLCVPESHIITLFDHDATRTAIIEGFRKLRDNEDINEGDPMFIFYAGHGLQQRAHPDWVLEGHNVQMEVILPYDCGAVNEEYPEGVEPIPDHTIGILIDEIAATKGDNITVVFDSCHSGSATRSKDGNSLALVRSEKFKDVPFRKETDREIWESFSRGAGPDEAHSRRGSGSHMLISACKSSEKATECFGRGRLSMALLKLLDRDNTSPNKFRYRDILANIKPFPQQNPQCEGYFQDRLLFTRKSLPPRKAYSIQFDKWTSKFTLGAGAANGIVISAEFTAYFDPDELLNPLGTFVVERLWPFKSDMIPLNLSSTLPSRGAFAIQTKQGKVEPFRLYTPPKDGFHRLYHLIRTSNTADLQGIFLVNNPGDAQLKILTSPSGDCLTFIHMDKRVTQHGMNLMRDGVESDPVVVGRILENAACYFRELNRTNSSHIITHFIEVEFHNLDIPRIRVAGHPIPERLKTVGPNLCRRGENKVIDSMVSDTASTRYGFKIINNSEEDLYVNAFYFDNTDCRIVPCYTTNCPSGGNSQLESPLKSDGELCVGYGAGGWEPFVYQLRKGQDLDVGFLKIYLSTQPVDFSGISTFPTWEPTSGWKFKPVDKWDTILIPVIHCRNPNSS